jgi:hypothetical protein
LNVITYEGLRQFHKKRYFQGIMSNVITYDGLRQ